MQYTHKRSWFLPAPDSDPTRPEMGISFYYLQHEQLCPLRWLGKELNPFFYNLALMQPLQITLSVHVM